ncbi:MAG TPA: TetR/AcrR family transcriptional regulator [Bdellovibrio sp.]|nr:TetR/AcrR family transcriptional regulator [Bdellovibrio sp.]
MEKTTRQEQKEKTRAGLISQAEILFAKYGISQTTTAEVAKALRVSHGTVFIHFSTRDDLVLAVVEKFGERLSAELGKRFSDELSLREMLQAHVAVLSEFEDFYLRLISESQNLSPQIRGILYAMNSSLSYRFYRASKNSMKEGRIKKIEQAPFFNIWLSLLHYHIQNRDLFSEKTPLLKEMGNDLIRQFLNLIKT